MPHKPSAYDHDHENEVTLFAETNFRNARRRFGIKTDDRRRHMYVIGKTGMGKTTLLENMVLSDVYAGHGLAFIDPHGDTAQRFLDFIPANRIKDVVYFNPADMAFPLGFNILESVDESHKHLIAGGLMGVFKKIWPDVWSARMEYMLLNTILALLDYPDSTLLGINRLLADQDYRDKVVAVIQDPIVKTFWLKEFAAFSEKYRIEAVAPIQNKVGQFLSAAIIRNIVAQSKSTINLREIMDKRKILIVNLSKGLLGEENAKLLGGMLVTKLQLAAMERVDIPNEADRQDFYLYVDEFQNFATESFANILSEARKYRLNLIMAHQYIEQLDETVQAGIFGNVGTMLVMRVGAPDAEVLVKEFEPKFTEEDLVNLKKYEMYLKLMIDGAASQPFSAVTLPPIAAHTGSHDKVIKHSRDTYAESRAVVEEKVLRWSGVGTLDVPGAILRTEDEEEDVKEKLKVLEDTSPKIPTPLSTPSGKKAKFQIPCAVCGKMQGLSFEPDWNRPWYCKEHIEEGKRLEKSKIVQGESEQDEVLERVLPIAPPIVKIVPPPIKVVPAFPPSRMAPPPIIVVKPKVMQPDRMHMEGDGSKKRRRRSRGKNKGLSSLPPLSNTTRGSLSEIPTQTMSLNELRDKSQKENQQHNVNNDSDNDADFGSGTKIKPGDVIKFD